MIEDEKTTESPAAGRRLDRLGGPSSSELLGIVGGTPIYTTDCGHMSGLHFDEYDDLGSTECRFAWCGEAPEIEDESELEESECFRGGYVCLVHDFQRGMSIADRLASIV